MADTLELSIHVNAKPETVFRFLSDSGWVIAGR